MGIPPKKAPAYKVHQPNSDGLHLTSDGLQPNSDGLHMKNIKFDDSLGILGLDLGRVGTAMCIPSNCSPGLGIRHGLRFFIS